MTIVSKSFGDRIKEARREQRISQRSLAEKVGINFTYLSKIENGELPPPAEDKIFALAENLGLDADELFHLAQRAPDELSKLAIQSQMPMILRAAKDLSEEDRREMLQWINKRRARGKQ